jgi:carbonic anhydrase
LQINDDVFNLVDIHFHAPGEHLVDGERPVLELHIYGSTQDGKLLESAILFKVGDENDFIQDIIETVGKTETSTFNLGSIYPQGELDNYYYYIGSTSAPFPDCIEGTSWIIRDKHLELSSEQLTYFQEVWKTFATYENKGRYRNVQPLNGRKVYHYQDDDDDDSAIYLALSYLLLAFFLI